MSLCKFRLWKLSQYLVVCVFHTVLMQVSAHVLVQFSLSCGCSLILRHTFMVYNLHICDTRFMQAMISLGYTNKRTKPCQVVLSKVYKHDGSNCSYQNMHMTYRPGWLGIPCLLLSWHILSWCSAVVDNPEVWLI